MTAPINQLTPKGYLTDWLLLGPFLTEGPADRSAAGGQIEHDAGHDRDFLEVLGGEAQAVLGPETQITYKAPSGQLRTARPQIVGPDLDDLERPDFCHVLDERHILEQDYNQCVGYAFCRVHSEQDQGVYAYFGSDGSAKIYLNHKLVHDFPRQRKTTPWQDRLKLDLRKGLNPLLIKVDNKTDWWGFQIALFREKHHLNGLRRNLRGLKIEDVATHGSRLRLRVELDPTPLDLRVPVAVRIETESGAALGQAEGRTGEPLEAALPDGYSGPVVIRAVPGETGLGEVKPGGALHFFGDYAAAVEAYGSRLSAAARNLGWLPAAWRGPYVGFVEWLARVCRAPLSLEGRGAGGEGAALPVPQGERRHNDPSPYPLPQGARAGRAPLSLEGRGAGGEGAALPVSQREKRHNDPSPYPLPQGARGNNATPHPTLSHGEREKDGTPSAAAHQAPLETTDWRAVRVLQYAEQFITALEGRDNYAARHPDEPLGVRFGGPSASVPPHPTLSPLERGERSTAAPTGQYFAFLPRGFGESAARYPLVIELHGSNAAARKVPLDKYNNPGIPAEGAPVIGIAPLTFTLGWDIEYLEAVLADVKARFPVDEDRVYLQGGSMGGKGTWDWATAHPEHFAALSVKCGAEGHVFRAARLKNVPVWIFNGEKDLASYPYTPELMVTALRRAGGEAKYTLFPDLAHGMGEAIDRKAVKEWFLEHKRSAAGPPADPLFGLDIGPDGISAVTTVDVPAQVLMALTEAEEVPYPEDHIFRAATKLYQAYRKTSGGEPDRLADGRVLLRTADGAGGRWRMLLEAPAAFEGERQGDLMKVNFPAMRAARVCCRGTWDDLEKRREALCREVDARGWRRTGEERRVLLGDGLKDEERVWEWQLTIDN